MEAESHALSNKKYKVLLFPWLATGHISPYLELAKILSNGSYFQPYLCSTAINLTSIHNTFKNNSWDFPIEFIELHLPELPDLPAHFHTAKDLPPHLKPTLRDAFQKSQPSFAQILNNLKPDVVIYDCFQPWAAKLALSMNIPCIHFYTAGAATLSYSTHFSTRRPIDSYPFPEIYITEAEIKRLMADFPTNHTPDEKDVSEKDLSDNSLKLSTNFVLLNSCKETEGKYMDHISSLIGKKIVPLGPLVQEIEALDSHRHIIEWLESKTPSSVLFVSFGSEYFLSKDEIEEIANGLVLSNANFLWAIRISKKDTMKEVLPEGFLERVENRGLVVEGWVPQAKILQHPNTGAFVSHCGWNSVIESFYFGVPVIAIPIRYDQPLNLRLIEGLGAGVEAARDENGRFDRVNIANVIKKVMVEKDGECIKEKARQQKKKLKIEKEVNSNGALQELWNVVQESKLKR